MMRSESRVINIGDHGENGAQVKFLCHFPSQFIRENSGVAGEILIGRTFKGMSGDLDGNYVKIQEIDQNIFEIDRDMFGSIPLFYSLERRLISTDIRELLSTGSVDWCSEGVSEYISCAFNSLGRTVYKNIFILRPDEAIRVNECNISIIKKRNYFNQTRIAGEVGQLLEDAIERSILNLSQEVGEQCILNLSGGNDSTLLLALLRKFRTDSEIYSNTFFHKDWREDFDDWRYAELAAKKYGTLHTLVNIENSSFEQAHKELVFQGRNVFHTYAAAFFMQNKVLNKFVKPEMCIINGSGPDETMIGTEKIPVETLIEMNKLSRNDWVKYAVNARDYLKIPESESEALLNDSGTGFIGRRLEFAEELSEQCESFVDFQRKYHSMLILQDHICELNQVATTMNRPIFFPFLTNDIFKIVFGATFQELNLNNVYKAAIKNILLKYMEPEFVHRQKIGFQSPSRKYFMSQDGFGQEIRKLLAVSRSSVFSMQKVRDAVQVRLSEDFSSTKRYDFVEWAVFNLLRLESQNER